MKKVPGLLLLGLTVMVSVFVGLCGGSALKPKPTAEELRTQAEKYRVQHPLVSETNTWKVAREGIVVESPEELGRKGSGICVIRARFLETKGHGSEVGALVACSDKVRVGAGITLYAPIIYHNVYFADRVRFVAIVH